jgi:branched-chain amino acid transport system permease protein
VSDVSMSRSGLNYVIRLAPWLAMAIIAGYFVTSALGTYTTFTVGTICVACVASIGLNLLVGNAGLISLATPAFMAIGAYGSAIVLQHTSFTLVGAVILSILVAVILGGLVGLLALRMSGFYLALATLGLLEAIQYFLVQGGSLVGGGYGFAMPTAYVGSIALTFEDWSGIAAAVLVLAIGGAWSIRRSSVGRALALLREHELVAGCMGINTVRIKIGAFALSAGLGALAGVLSGFVEGAVSPNVFSLTLGVSQLAFIIFGGLGFVSGAVVGTAFLMALPVWFSSLGTNAGILYAAILLVVVVVAPKGMVSLGIDGFRNLRRRLTGSKRLGEAEPGTPSSFDVFVSRFSLSNRYDATTHQLTNVRVHDVVNPSDVEMVEKSGHQESTVTTGSLNRVEFQEASVRYGGLLAVDSASFSVARGSVHGLIGPNGAGKSSAVAALFGLTRLASGVISLDGKELQSTSKQRPPWSVAQRGVGRTFQTPAAGMGLTVLESVENGMYSKLRTGYIRAGLRTPLVVRNERLAQLAALEALELVRFTASPRKMVSELTLGELRRVELARVLAPRPSVIILDEPTSGLELGEADGLFSLFQELTKQEDRSVLIVEHNVRLIFQYCDDVTVLNLGRVIASGPPSSIAEHDAVKEAYLGRR